MLWWALCHVNRYEIPVAVLQTTSSPTKLFQQLQMKNQKRIIRFKWNGVECISVPTREVSMRRLLASFFMIGAICFATWTGNGAITFAAEGGGDATALQADNALQLALRKKDVKAVSAFLDQQFSCTNEAGQTRTSAQFLKDAAAGSAVGDTEYTDVKGRD